MDRTKIKIPSVLSDPKVREKVIVALDLDLSDCGYRDFLFGFFAEQGFAVKIGSQAFTRHGPSILEKAKDLNLRVFLDLKFHDIPHTVAQASACVVELGVWMFTVHVAGGREMLEQCRKSIDQKSSALGCKRPLLLGVTVLTSQKASMDEVFARAQLAKQSGCDGVICSAWEAKKIREVCGTEFLVVTPGIRFEKANSDDQVRVATPQEALGQGADFLVLGRAILNLLP